MKTVIEAALNEYLKEVSFSIDTKVIEAVTDLPAKFRFSAAKELLTDREFSVIIKTGVRKSYSDKWIGDYVSAAKEAIKRMAYRKSYFGRYQSTHEGRNVRPSLVTVRTESGERYSKKYTSSDLYADFFFAAQEDNPFNFIFKIPTSEKIEKVSLFDLNLYFSKDGRPWEFIYDNKLFKKCKFEFDRKEISVKYEGQEYHIKNSEVFASDTQNTQTVKRIITAFQRRKRAIKKDAAFISLNLSNIVVTIEDSIRAGNCEVGTANFVKDFFANEVKEGKEITAEMVWSKRKDDFTKRAILQASKNIATN